MPVIPAKCARFPRFLKRAELLSVHPSHDSNGEPRCGNHKFWSRIQLENFSLKYRVRFPVDLEGYTAMIPKGFLVFIVY